MKYLKRFENRYYTYFDAISHEDIDLIKELIEKKYDLINDKDNLGIQKQQQ